MRYSEGEVGITLRHPRTAEIQVCVLITAPRYRSLVGPLHVVAVTNPIE